MSHPDAHWFLGIGAQKAGTTWLHDQLALHPQVALPARKEVHYFDMVHPPAAAPRSFGMTFTQSAKRHVERLRTGVGNADTHLDRLDDLVDLLALNYTGSEGYREYLCRAADDATRAIGEITPAYSILDDVGFAHVVDTLPDVRVVFVMRDPLERYWSAVRMRKIEDAERRQQVFQNSIGQPGVWRRSDYRTTIETVERHVPRDHVQYLFYEDLFNEDRLREVARFLGVAEQWDWDLSRQSNVSPAHDMPDGRDEVLDRLRPVYEFVHERFGDAVPDQWHG